MLNVCLLSKVLSMAVAMLGAAAARREAAPRKRVEKRIVVYEGVVC